MKEEVGLYCIGSEIVEKLSRQCSDFRSQTKRIYEETQLRGDRIEVGEIDGIYFIYHIPSGEYFTLTKSALKEISENAREGDAIDTIKKYNPSVNKWLRVSNLSPTGLALILARTEIKQLQENSMPHGFLDD